MLCSMNKTILQKCHAGPSFRKTPQQCFQHNTNTTLISPREAARRWCHSGDSILSVVSWKALLPLTSCILCLAVQQKGANICWVSVSGYQILSTHLPLLFNLQNILGRQESFSHFRNENYTVLGPGIQFCLALHSAFILPPLTFPV